jgi:chromate reductase, NAD(P)H dehydrogenase (quinone)
MAFNVLTVSGSLRAASSNTGLIKMAQRLAPAELVIADPYPIRDLPFYDGDLDTPETLPAVCAAWRTAVADCDALLWAAPEYNYSVSGVMKNAIDWASRPFGANALGGLVSTVVTSAGGGGGSKCQEYLINVLGLLGGTVVNDPEIGLKMGPGLVSADGSTTDPEVEALVSARLANLLAHLTNA